VPEHPPSAAGASSVKIAPTGRTDRPGAARALAEFTTARAQLLNQSPELRNC